MHDGSQLLRAAGIRSETDAKALEIPRATYYRAKNGSINKHLEWCLNLRAGRDPHWLGYQFRNGRIITPTGTLISKHLLDNLEAMLMIEYQRGRSDAENVQLKLAWDGVTAR